MLSKRKRDTAYAATKTDLLAAKQLEIDALAAKVAGAQGTEKRILELHLAGLVAEYATMVTDINAETEKIVKDIKINIATNYTPGTFSAGAQSGDAGDASGGNTAIFNEDGTMQSGAGQEFHLDSSGNAFFNESLTNPVSDELQDSVNEALGHDNLAGAAAGGIFLPRPGGQLVNIAEGGEPEAVLNPSQLAEAMGIGSGGQGGRGGNIVLMLNGEVLGEAVIDSLYDAANTGHLNIDELQRR